MFGYECLFVWILVSAVFWFWVLLVKRLVGMFVILFVFFFMFLLLWARCLLSRLGMLWIFGWFLSLVFMILW